MKKKWISALLLAGLVLLLSGCGKPMTEKGPVPLSPLPSITPKEEEPDPMEGMPEFHTPEDPVVFSTTSDHVRPIGRTVYHDDALWCTYSGSGMEFFFAGQTCEITFLQNGIPEEGHAPRVAIYVDGDRTQDFLLTEEWQTVTVLASEEDTIATVRVVKLSEVTDSVFGIESVTTVGAISPIMESDRYIEFIGDSITCGYGVDGVLGEDVYSTANEDCTKAYAYLTASMLGADYSLVSISGFGIVSGYTDSGEKLADKVMPLYYENLGKSYGSLSGDIAPEDIAWDFSNREPDIIVINLGTNDASYCGDDEERRREYIDGYKEFLGTVRRNNPEAVIVCTLGIMGTTLCDSMETAVAEFREETGDRSIRTMRFTEQDAADGLAVDWHPSETTHAKAAVELTDFLTRLTAETSPEDVEQ